MEWVNHLHTHCMILLPITHSPPAQATAESASGSPGDSRITARPIPSFCLECEHGDTGPQVRIVFPASAISRVWIESRRGTTDWEFVAITTDRACLDPHPLRRPGEGELREYRARYFDRATPQDPWSPPQKIAVEPWLSARSGEVNFQHEPTNQSLRLDAERYVGG